MFANFSTVNMNCFYDPKKDVLFSKDLWQLRGQFPGVGREGSHEAKVPASNVTKKNLSQGRERNTGCLCAAGRRAKRKGEFQKGDRGWGEEAPGPCDVTPVEPSIGQGIPAQPCVVSEVPRERRKRGLAVCCGCYFRKR